MYICAWTPSHLAWADIFSLVKVMFSPNYLRRALLAVYRMQVMDILLVIK